MPAVIIGLHITIVVIESVINEEVSGLGRRIEVLEIGEGERRKEEGGREEEERGKEEREGRERESEEERERKEGRREERVRDGESLM